MTVEWNCLISANFIMCIVSLEKEGNNEKKFFYYTNIFKSAIKLVTAAYLKFLQVKLGNYYWIILYKISLSSNLSILKWIVKYWNI